MYKKQSPEGKPINYFSVESISEFLAKIIKMGSKITQPEEEVLGVGWIAAAEDPEGNQFALIQPIRV
jgi:predicted enzyme related to lactoylglutathione lyase